ncbi:hypothetical protein CGRA01v4_05060 [Colletotrichum graminicola]|nr:hypothetical protein CGRA01v4_05060 [Colletotrichum graminicola]
MVNGSRIFPTTLNQTYPDGIVPEGRTHGPRPSAGPAGGAAGWTHNQPERSAWVDMKYPQSGAIC